MQSVSSKIWTLVAVSISYDDNHYTTHTSANLVEVYDFLIGWLVSLFNGISTIVDI